MMRIIIAGSRTVSEQEVRAAMERCPWIGFASAVVSGTARGADQIGEKWAREHGLEVIRFPADWKRYGKRAGPIRNLEMAKNAEGLLAVWNGSSRGTRDMIENAVEQGLRVFVLRVDSRRTEEYPARGRCADVWESAEERAAIREEAAGFSRAEAEREAGISSRPDRPM